EPFNAELLKGAARAIRGTGYDLVVFSDCGQREDQVGWERRSLARVSALTDGVVLVTPSGTDFSSSAPIVAVDHNVRSGTLPTTASENLNGALPATQHLLDLGHRRIGFVAGRPDLESAPLREQGYRQAPYAAGISLRRRPRRGGENRRGAPLSARSAVGGAGYHPETAREAPRARLLREPRPTAIFAANDASAIETI